MSQRTTTSSSSSHATGTARRSGATAFSVLVGLTSLAVLLQGLWAGLMVPVGEGGDYRETWVEIHGHGADVAIALALLSTVVAVWKLRDLRPLWLGAGALTVLLALEGFLGGLVSDSDARAAAVVHVPLALALMGLAVWLPFATRRALAAAR